jgi:chaperonin cofactor prefoldin
MARKEEIFISELSDDAPERKTVTERITKRSKETVEKLTKVQDELKEKKEKITKENTGLKDDIKGMTEKLSAIQAKIATSQETLKLKIAERTSKKTLAASYAGKSGQKTGAVANAVSIEGALVSQGAVEKLTKDITELREKIKKNIQQKNEFFSTKITTQK